MDIPTASVLGHRDPALVPETHMYGRGETWFEEGKRAGWAPRVSGRGRHRFGGLLGALYPSGAKATGAMAHAADHPLTSRVMVNRSMDLAFWTRARSHAERLRSTRVRRPFYRNCWIGSPPNS